MAVAPPAPPVRKTRFPGRLAAAAAVLLAVLALGAFLYARKEETARQLKDFLFGRVWKGWGLELKVAGAEGSLFGGAVVLRGVQIHSPELPSHPLLFEAERVSFRYRPFDFFLENVAGWVRIEIDRPVFYANVPFAPEAPERQTVQLFSQVVSRVKRRTKLVIRDGAIAWLGQEGTLSGIEGTIEARTFDLDVGLSHVRLGSADLSTELRASGALETDPKTGEDVLRGFFSTRGTVVNWKPVEHESRGRYTLTKDALYLEDSSFFGGIELVGKILHLGDRTLDLAIRTRDYPLEVLNEALSRHPDELLSGRADAELTFSGAAPAPMVKGQILVKDSRMGDTPLKNMQLNFEGVWPEVRVSQSRMVLPDGTTMNFASQTLPISELLVSDTYEKLVGRADQKDVSWGDWRLRREETDDSVLLERELGSLAKVRYERFERDEARFGPQENPDEVEMEYLLPGSNSLKMQVREDEEFIGVQRKVSF
jgi:hypothetical protein